MCLDDEAPGGRIDPGPEDSGCVRRMKQWKDKQDREQKLHPIQCSATVFETVAHRLSQYQHLLISRWHSELLFVYLSLMKFDHPIIPLLGRLLMSYIFLTSGLAKVFSWEGNIQYMSTRHLPAIPVLLALAVVIELGGTICLVTGYQARVAALVMFGYMIVLTVIFHNYWSLPGNMAGMQETQFRKNLAIAGGLLFLAHSGPGRWSLGRK